MTTVTKRLGKLPKKTDRRTLQLGRYLNAMKLPTPPASVDHSSRLPAKIGSMGNDKYGDCAIAAPGHMVQSWSVYADYPMATIPDTEILKSYFTLSPNDEGCNMLDVMNYWRKTGIGGDKIEAFVETAPASLIQAKLTILYFGSLFIGMSLPNTNTFGPWDVKKPSWPANVQNGHAVCLLSYNDNTEMFKVATWGEVWNMSYDWFRKYVDESYACLNDISLNATGLTPEGFDLKALQYDLAHIGDPIVDPPTPTPTPTPTPVPPAPAPGPVPPFPVPPTPSPAPSPAARGPIKVTGSERWVVTLNGVDQLPNHLSSVEAVQHADQLRWARPGSTIVINHRANYRVE
jgi:hypothetical protein